MPRSKIFLFAVALLIASIVIQAQLGKRFGVAIDAPLAVLFAATLFLDIPSLVLLSLLAALLLAASPGIAPESLLIVILPLLARGIRRFTPLTGWSYALCAAIAGVLLFYLILAPFAVLRAPWALVADLAASAAVALLSFAMLRKTSRTSARTP